MDVGDQIGEVLELHRGMKRKAARDRALELMRMVGIPDPERRLKNYPHEMSGGMAQRVMIAMALACEPELLIADEPTTALDVTIQAQILDLMRTLQKETGTAIILITHDLGVVAEMCRPGGGDVRGRDRGADATCGRCSPRRCTRTPRDSSVRCPCRASSRTSWRSSRAASPTSSRCRRAAGSRPGARHASTHNNVLATELHPELREAAPRSPGALLAVPPRGRQPAARSRHVAGGDAPRVPVATSRLAVPEADRRIAAARPRMSGLAPPAAERPVATTPLVELGAHQVLSGPGGVLQRTVAEVRAVDGVDLRHPARGDARARRRVGLRQDDRGPAAAAAHRADRRVDRVRRPGHHPDLTGSALRPYRRRMQIIFQDPYASLDPRAPIGDSIGEGLRIHGIGTPAERRRASSADDGPRGARSRTTRARYPHEFSGGQRQRIGIARALVLEPELIVCDEPVSALDVSIQAQVLNLLQASSSASWASPTCSSPTTWASWSTSATAWL